MMGRPTGRGPTRRAFLGMAGAAAASATMGLTALEGVTASASALNGAAKGPMTFWNGFTASDRQYIVDIVNRWNKNNPKSKVDMTIEPWDTEYGKLPTSLATGQGPDLPAMDVELLPTYTHSKVLEPVDGVWHGHGMKKSMFPKSYIESATIQGHFWALPMTIEPIMLYYNKKMFSDAGITGPPSTMDDLFKIAIELTKVGSNGQQYGFVMADNAVTSWWTIIAYAYGGGLISSNGKKSLLDDPNTIKAWQTWADAQKQHKISPVGLSGADGDQLIQTSKGAMEMSGPWLTAGFTQAGLDFDVAPIPVGPAGHSITLGGASVIPLAKSSASKKEEAEAFMAFFNSKWAQILYAKGAGGAPSRVDLLSDLKTISNPYPAKFAAVQASARVELPGTRVYNEIMTNVVTPAVQAVIRGADVKSTLKKAADDMNDLLKNGPNAS